MFYYYYISIDSRLIENLTQRPKKEFKCTIKNLIDVSMKVIAHKISIYDKIQLFVVLLFI